MAKTGPTSLFVGGLEKVIRIVCHVNDQVTFKKSGFIYRPTKDADRAYKLINEVDLQVRHINALCMIPFITSMNKGC